VGPDTDPATATGTRVLACLEGRKTQLSCKTRPRLPAQILSQSGRVLSDGGVRPSGGSAGRAHNLPDNGGNAGQDRHTVGPRWANSATTGTAGRVPRLPHERRQGPPASRAVRGPGQLPHPQARRHQQLAGHEPGGGYTSRPPAGPGSTSSRCSSGSSPARRPAAAPSTPSTNSSARSAPSSKAGTIAANPPPGPREPTRTCPTPPLREIQTRDTSYDLARLRDNGLIGRRSHSNTYDLTADGLRVAIFYTKVQDRLLRPLIAADQPPVPQELRSALTVIDRHVHTYVDSARMVQAA